MEERYVVSARKYRPLLFREVVGQETVTQTLRNAIRSGHLAQAYLFSGPRGVGKTTVARILAKTINCENPSPEGEPCNECESCRLFMENRSYNIHELDAASNNKVEHIRDLIDQVRIPPQMGKYSVYIIDEVHMLTQQAFNAFLKTLEEPPHYAIFIMATTEKGKVLPTILSRCQVFDFNRITVEDIVKHLEYVSSQEGIHAEPEALNVIARKADGALRDALSIFDQMVSFSGKEVTYKAVIDTLNILDHEYYFNITRALFEGDVQRALLLLDEVMMKGFEPRQLLSGLSAHFRDLLVARDAATLPLLEVSEAVREKYLAQAREIPAGLLFRALDICYHFDITLKDSKNQRLHAELAFLRISDLKKNDGRELKASSLPEEDPDNKGKSGNIAGDGTIRKEEKKEVVAGQKIPPSPPVEKEPAKEEKKSRQDHQEKAANIPEVRREEKTAAGKGSFLKDHDTDLDTINIRSALEEGAATLQSEQEKAEEEKAGTEREKRERDEPFDEARLKEVWLAYAGSLDRDKPRLAAALRSHDPDLPEALTVRITVENKNLKENFERDLLPDLLDHLRETLHNDHIILRIDVEEIKGNGTKKPYTPEEKFEYLKKKNPDLDHMKKLFDLDFE